MDSGASSMAPDGEYERCTWPSDGCPALRGVQRASWVSRFGCPVSDTGFARKSACAVTSRPISYRCHGESGSTELCFPAAPTWPWRCRTTRALPIRCSRLRTESRRSAPAGRAPREPTRRWATAGVVTMTARRRGSRLQSCRPLPGVRCVLPRFGCRPRQQPTGALAASVSCPPGRWAIASLDRRVTGPSGQAPLASIASACHGPLHRPSRRLRADRRNHPIHSLGGAQHARHSCARVCPRSGEKEVVETLRAIVVAKPG